MKKTRRKQGGNPSYLPPKHLPQQPQNQPPDSIIGTTAITISIPVSTIGAPVSIGGVGIVEGAGIAGAAPVESVRIITGRIILIVAGWMVDFGEAGRVFGFNAWVGR